jgi:hypothetical protein
MNWCILTTSGHSHLLLKITTLMSKRRRRSEKVMMPTPKAPSLFDTPAPVSAIPTYPSDPDEEAEILAEMNQDQETEEEDYVLVAS